VAFEINLIWIEVGKVQRYKVNFGIKMKKCFIAETLFPIEY
jgi:hypothetical protein